MKNIKFSKIDLLGSSFLRVFAIQSARQFASYIAATLIGFIIFQAILIIFKHPIASPLILAFAFSGSSVILRMTLPAKFIIFFKSEQEYLEVRNFLERILKSQSYRKISQSNIESIFQTKLPPILRWSENEIFLTISNENIIVKGPIFMVRILHKNLSRKFNN